MNEFRPEGAKRGYPELVVSLWLVSEDHPATWAYAVHESTSEDEPLIFGGEATWPTLRDAVWRAVEDADEARVGNDAPTK